MTPKKHIPSTYRQAPYPLKREAVAGITPVFNNLLKAGAIIPCAHSPISPIFNVEKIRTENQLAEWSIVPQSHTILSQESMWVSIADWANAFFYAKLSHGKDHVSKTGDDKHS